MKDLSWVNHPAMKNIDARKMRIIVNLLNEVEGQPADRAITALMRANQELRSQGLAFSQQEQAVIIEIITRDLAPNQRGIVDMVQNMINSYKHP